MLATANTVNNALWTSSRISSKKYINWVKISHDSSNIDSGVVIFKVLTPAIDIERCGVKEVEDYIKKLGVSEIVKKCTRFPQWSDKYNNFVYETKITVTFF